MIVYCLASNRSNLGFFGNYVADGVLDVRCGGWDDGLSVVLSAGLLVHGVLCSLALLGLLSHELFLGDDQTAQGLCRLSASPRYVVLDFGMHK